MKRSKWLTGFILGCAFALPAGFGYGAINFEDVSQAANINFVGESYGASWGDVNGDGCPDIFANNHRQRPSLYVNQCNGRFQNTAWNVLTWRNQPLRDTHGGAFGDYDNDGDQDLLVTTGTTHANQFLQSNNGELVDRTSQFNLTFTHWEGNMFSWFDLNNDGKLDFISGQNNGQAHAMQRASGNRFTAVNNQYGINCFSARVIQFSDLNRDGNQDAMCNVFQTPLNLYNRNRKPWTKANGWIPQHGISADVVLADFDNNLRPDMLSIRRGPFHMPGLTQVGSNKIEAHLSGYNGSQSFKFTGAPGAVLTAIVQFRHLNRNNLKVGGSGTVSGTVDRDHTITLNPNSGTVRGFRPPNGTGVSIGYNPSTRQWTFAGGHTRFYNIHFRITGTGALSNTVATGFAKNGTKSAPYLFMNSAGAGNTPNFTKGVQGAVAAGLNIPIYAIGATAADFDNDMDLDLYVITNGGARNEPNILYVNDGTGRFTARTGNWGGEGPVGPNQFSGAGSGDQAIAADYNNDGYMDVFLVNGINLEPYHGGGPSVLLQNRSFNSNRWIQVDLRGTASNRDGIGAVVYATVPSGKRQMREQNGGYRRTAQDHQRIHFGLGSNQRVDLEIRWPNGRVDRHNNVLSNRFYQATQAGALTIRNIAGTPPPVDTDNDGLFDDEERDIYNTDPNDPDSDDGGVNDGDEVNVYQLDPNDSSDDSKALDADNDGLSDWDEDNVHQTDKNNPDTDGGGVEDGAEVNVHNLDPLEGSDDDSVLDPDGDGLSNRQENDQYNTDPNNPDTDGGGVNDGDEVAAGTDPLLPGDDIVLSNDVCGRANVDNSNQAGVFLGLICDGSNRWHLLASGGGVRSVRYANGTIEVPGGISGVTRTKFESNDLLGSGNGDATAFALRVWGTDRDEFSFIAPPHTCIELDLDPALPLHLGAGKVRYNGQSIDLSTGRECQATPLPSDRDGDGLSDADEINIYSTDPDLPDTDAGGVNDGDEVANGTDPNDPDDDIPVDPDIDIDPSACAAPNLDSSVDRGLHVWYDCNGNSERWFVAATGGNRSSTTVFSGNVAINGGLGSLQTVRLESNDQINGAASNNPTFELRIWRLDTDQFNFKAPVGGCLSLTGTSDLSLYAGAGKVPIAGNRIDLATGRACTP